MANSTTAATRRKTANSKPAKPYADFPLFAHATRRWAKKIRGRMVYFGPWDDPDGALEKYLAEKDYLHAGKTPPENLDGLTVRELCNRFLNAKKHLLNTREITPRTWQDYHTTCQRLVDGFEKSRLVDDLASDDFRRLRVKLAKTRGPVALGNEIQRVRSVFKFGFDEGLIEKPVRYGQSFKKPSRKTLRKERARKTAENGKRMFEADELRRIIEGAGVPLKAMILLGINCGLGNSDCAELPRAALDLDGGWIDYARVKTGIERRCPLWSETVAALRDAIGKRPIPSDAVDADLVFITKYGKRWSRTYGNGTPDDVVGQETAKLLRSLELKRVGVSFYALRHTFQTVGEESRDHVAVSAIMGHVDDSMSAHYREGVSDERLTAVTDTVHRWLFDK